MQEIGIGQVCEEIGRAFAKNDLQRVDQLLWPALDQFHELPQLWFYAGNLSFHTGKVALADQCFQRCIDLDMNPHVLANQGAAKRRLNEHEQGIAVLEAALERLPEYEPALVNLGSMFVNEGTPDKGIVHLERAKAIGEKKGRYERGCMWNLGLLYLESGRFREGFEIYRTGLGTERMIRSYGCEPKGIAEPEMLTPEHTGAGKTLIAWGEQGIGDELMAGTLLEEARREFGEVIFECHPRLEQLHRDAHPGMRIYPTRKDERIRWPVDHAIKANYKCPVLDLAARYRPDLASFKAGWRANGNPYRNAWGHDRFNQSVIYRRQLAEIAKGRPVVALATHGGVMQTARMYRTMRPADLDYLFEQTDAVFVSIDYDDMTAFAMHVQDKFGPDRFVWHPSIVQHWDYHHVAHLIAATDMTVSVCQSAAHLSAGMGHPTRVLVPSRCAWRYAKIPDEPELWFWYPGEHARLYRQEGDSWAAPLASVVRDIKELQS